jgi:hypothetical protein
MEVFSQTDVVWYFTKNEQKIDIYDSWGKHYF